MSFGADPRWKQEQEEIYWHAKGLGIADTPHPWGADRKEGTEDDLTKGQWKSFTDRLNARKAEATAGGTQDFVLGSTDEQNRRSSDWYRTQEGRDYAESLGLPGGFGINTAFQDGGAAAAAAAAPLVTGGGAPGSSLYPMGLVDYEAPTAMPGIPLEYQPWLQPAHIPDSLWNYQPPTLTSWDLDPRMGWADTPVSEFAPEEESSPTRPDGEGTQWGGGSQPDPKYDFDHLADASDEDLLATIWGLEDFDKWEGLTSEDPTVASAAPVNSGVIARGGNKYGGNLSDFGAAINSPQWK